MNGLTSNLIDFKLQHKNPYNQVSKRLFSIYQLFQTAVCFPYTIMSTSFINCRCLELIFFFRLFWELATIIRKSWKGYNTCSMQLPTMLQHMLSIIYCSNKYIKANIGFDWCNYLRTIKRDTKTSKKFFLEKLIKFWHSLEKPNNQYFIGPCEPININA